jgi:Tfp pilus assembly protein PilF
MEYRDTTKNLRQIARELSVANVMEGSVQRAGDRVRINVQLIDANTDEHLWADIYDRELTTGNLFDIQSEIAQAIAAALKATLTNSELASVADVPTENVEAYDLYLQARRFSENETMHGKQTAIELLKKSLELDADFKFARIDLARAHLDNYWVYGGDTANLELALEAIERARNIDAQFAELHLAEGVYWYWGQLDYERALYNLEKAIEMMPGDDEAYMWRGYVSRRAGLWEQARESMQHSLKLNPRVHFNWYEYALTLLFMHRYEEASRAANQARTLAPDSFWGKIMLAQIALQERGDTQTALEMTVGAQHSDDFDFFELFMQARILAHQYDEALQAARDLSDELEIQRGSIILREDWAAQILHFMGHEDEARQAANAALFRLQGLRAELGKDYRLDLAEARLAAIQGSTPEEVRAMVRKSMSSLPEDKLAEFEFKLDYAQIFGIAGIIEAPECIPDRHGLHCVCLGDYPTRLCCRDKPGCGRMGDGPGDDLHYPGFSHRPVFSLVFCNDDRGIEERNRCPETRLINPQSRSQAGLHHDGAVGRGCRHGGVGSLYAGTDSFCTCGSNCTIRN